MYIDAHYNKFNDKVDVRIANGNERKIKSFKSSAFIADPVNDVLLKHFTHAECPELNVMYFDIETDASQGFNKAVDPSGQVPIISFAVSFGGDVLVHAVPPPKPAVLPQIPYLRIEKSEADLLNELADYISIADIITGWNSLYFDLPFAINRIKKIIPHRLPELAPLANNPYPATKYHKKEMPSMIPCIATPGIVQLDYKLLFKTHNQKEMPSYKLDAIAQEEIGAQKLPFKGSFDDFYRNEFSEFVRYNRIDVELLLGLDEKLKLIELTNERAHFNSLRLQDIDSPTKVLVQAVAKQALHVGDQFPSIINPVHEKPAGAFVAETKAGIYPWVASMDISSLYPNIIRSLNISPDTFIAQIRPVYTDIQIPKKEKRWDGIKSVIEYQMIHDMKTEPLILDFSDGSSIQVSAPELFLDWLKDRNYTLTANGTIFHTNFRGLLPLVIDSLYDQRVKLKEIMNSAETNEERELYDLRQKIKKIDMNSLYGALGQQSCELFDARLAQSITLTGRMVVDHMLKETEKLGVEAVAGDTDSVYFTSHKDYVCREQAMCEYDKIVEQVNATIPSMMSNNFLCDPNDSKISAEREKITELTYFLKQKSYITWEEGRMSITGTQIKKVGRTDYIREKILEIVECIKQRCSVSQIEYAIQQIESEMQSVSIEKIAEGFKSNDLDNGTQAANAATIFNELHTINKEKIIPKISAGDQMLRFFTSPSDCIGFPRDYEDQIQQCEWFMNLDFDRSTMIRKHFTDKIKGAKANDDKGILPPYKSQIERKNINRMFKGVE